MYRDEENQLQFPRGRRMVEKVAKYLQLLNGLGTGSLPRCMAPQRHAERGKEGNACAREMPLMFSKMDLFKGRRKKGGGHSACPKNPILFVAFTGTYRGLL